MKWPPKYVAMPSIEGISEGKTWRRASARREVRYGGSHAGPCQAKRKRRRLCLKQWTWTTSGLVSEREHSPLPLKPRRHGVVGGWEPWLINAGFVRAIT